MPLPQLDFKGPNRKYVYGITGITWPTGEVFNEGQAAYIEKCEECVVQVDAKTSKVFVDQCKDLTIEIHVSPTTSTIEIRESKNLNIVLKDESVVVNTIMIDDSENVRISITNSKTQLEKIWWHKVSGVSVTGNPDLGVLRLDKLKDNNEIVKFQHVCQVKEDGTFTIDPVLRDQGYPMTEAELIYHKEQERIGSEGMLKEMLKGIRMDEKEFYSQMRDKMDNRPSGSNS